MWDFQCLYLSFASYVRIYTARDEVEMNLSYVLMKKLYLGKETHSHVASRNRDELQFDKKCSNVPILHQSEHDTKILRT